MGKKIYKNCYIIGTSKNSSIIQGSKGKNTGATNNSGSYLSEEEQELICIYRKQPLRKKAEFLQMIFSFEDMAEHSKEGT